MEIKRIDDFYTSTNVYILSDDETKDLVNDGPVTILLESNKSF